MLCIKLFIGKNDVSVKVNQLMKMKDVRELAHCLLLDDVVL